MAKTADADLDLLINRQRRLIIAGSALVRSIQSQGRASPSEILQARLLAAELRQTLAALQRLGSETSAAVGQAVVGRAASLAYLSVGRAGRLH